MPIDEKEDFSWQKAVEIKQNKEGDEQLFNWSCDYSAGLITFNVAPAVNTLVVASFNFDVPVRFDTDSMPRTYG